MASNNRRDCTRRQFLSRAGTAGIALAHFWPAAAIPGAVPSAPPQAEDPLDTDLASMRETFLSPADSARPMTRWWWFGGAVTPEEITRELTLMRDGGLGGAEIQPVYPLEVDDRERGIRNLRYFSREWFELLQHTVEEARRLNLQLDLTLGSGWPYGGPFIPVELAARRLHVLSQDVAGPGELSRNLSPHITGGDRIVAAVAAPVLASQQPDLSRSQVITDQIKELVVNNLRAGRGLQRWPVPEGEWRIMVFLDGPTGMQVKRPTPGMEGPVLDHFSREAMELFLRAAGDRVLEALKPVGGVPFQSVFCDSLEVYGADWTPNLLQEFRARRGYDLTPLLPALWQEAGAFTPHVRYDYHLTLSDLLVDNFFRPLAEWSQQRGLQARIQAHGAFGDVIEGYARAQIPEGETIFLGDRYQVNVRHRRLASSAAHLYGKPLVSAETYTWLRVPLFLVTLEMMKAVTDATFLDGINQIVNHGYPYSPPEAGQPGWVFYASTLINHNNTWWRHYPQLAAYIQRAAALLQRGVAVSQVAVYIPLADIFAKFGCGALHIDVEIENHLGKELFQRLREEGFDFDLINDSALQSGAKVEDGKLRAGTAAYSATLVPGVRYMPPESLERLVEFAERGGIVIFIEQLPEAAPGLAHQDERTGRLRTSLRKLFGDGEPVPGKPVPLGSGKVAFVTNPAEALAALRASLCPDFRIVEAGDLTEAALQRARGNVGFIRRRSGPVDYYFVSNVSEHLQDLRVRFAVGHRRPERWNPESGVCEETPVYQYALAKDEQVEVTEVQLRLGPFESCFVVFGADSRPPALTRTNYWGPLRLESHRRRVRAGGVAAENGDYWLEAPGGRRHRFSVRGLPAAIQIDGPWTLKLGESSPITLAQLHSWNDLPEGRAYSGWGLYETTFEIARLAADIEWVLDLGRVHETAEVELNGVELGVAWKGVRQLPCRDALQPGMNRLKVEVANLWIHKVLSLPERDLETLAETYGIRWGRYGEIKPERVPPSGLLGPVRLLPMKRWSVRL